ncbi:MAG: hypothetical protein AAB785_03205 [Patescibacteria group bacterium]
MINKNILIIILLVLILGAGGYFLYNKFYRQNPIEQSSQNTQNKEVWQDKGVAIAGKFADADLVDLGDDRFRLYYSVEPEVAGNKLELYSSISTDGINWTKEEGVRKEFATFPSVIKLEDGGFRLYFQNAGVIKSALSEDGLSWDDESGIRIEAIEENLTNIENVGAQTIIQLEDKSFLMVYRVMLKVRYSQEVPNDSTQILYYATSQDGISWEKKGLALDSRNSTFNGLIDGAELVKWDPSSTSSGQVQARLYFWSYKGIYHINFEKSNFSQEPVFDFSNNPSSQGLYPPNPPGDPTLGKIQGKWYLFYGQHEKGIYYAVLE